MKKFWEKHRNKIGFVLGAAVTAGCTALYPDNPICLAIGQCLKNFLGGP